MARDTTPIGEDVVIGSNTPPVETTVEALIRAYNRLPLNTSLTTGDRMEWDGTKWVPVGKDTSLAKRQSGLYYPAPSHGSTTTFAMVNERVYYLPWGPFTSGNLDSAAVEVTGAGNAGAVIRIGIYSDDGGKPGALVEDWGTKPADAVATPTWTIATAVGSGILWVAAVAQSAATTPPSVRAANGSAGPWIGSSDTNQALNYWNAARHENAVSGALPATATPAAMHPQSKAPVVILRAA